MKKIDTSYDPLIKTNYDLYSTTLFELKDLVKTWYSDVELKEFDERFMRNDDRDVQSYYEMKKSGVVCNYFFVYKEDDRYYLMDGFNRLLTNYSNVPLDVPIYLKIITDKLEDAHLMSIMFYLNMWKLNNTRLGGFETKDFLDRGFRLFIYSKFNIVLYDYNSTSWKERTRNTKDKDILDKYFVSETNYAGYFKWGYDEISILFSNKQVVNDFRELLKGNDYLTEPFRNYEMFLEGYAMFISYLRVKGNEDRLYFQTFLDLLYEDKKFYKKLCGMSGTDSTRINIYKFFRNLDPKNYTK